MAKVKISEFSATAANNTDIDGININEGCAPSGINDAIRELMAQLKDFQTGAVGDSFNGPIGTSTASTGAFTTLSATGAITSTLATGTAPLVIASTTKVANLNVDLLDGADWAAPAALGSTTPAAVSATTLAASSTVTLSGGTANGVAYLNGSKVVTSGSALTFDGTALGAARAIFTAADSAYAVAFNATTGNARILGYDSTYGSTALVTYSASYAGYGPFTVDASNHRWWISGSEQMRLTSTGLGIGTSSPNRKLEVASSTAALIRITSSAASGTGYAANEFYNGAGFGYCGTESSTAGTLFVGTTAYATILGNTAAYPIQFATNNTVRATLDSSGNLGLGVTPSAWATLKAIDVSTWASFAGFTNQTNVLGNAYFDGSVYRYKQTSIATRYEQNNTTPHAWFTAASGTAGNAITFTQAMTLDASGNLGVGVTSVPQTGASKEVSINGATSTSLNFLLGGTNTNYLFSDSTRLLVWANGASTNLDIGTGSANAIRMFTNNTERARIDSSGNLLVGTTSTSYASGERVSITSLTNNGLGIAIGNVNKVGLGIYNGYTATGTATAVEFQDHNGNVRGSITVTTTGTLYNVTSDYRLKTVVGAVANAGQRIDALQPIEYEWKSDGSRTRGFLAHQFQEVYAGSVSGTKDAVDAEGNPVYQTMQASTSEVIADLVAEIQSLRKRLADAGI